MTANIEKDQSDTNKAASKITVNFNDDTTNGIALVAEATGKVVAATGAVNYEVTGVEIQSVDLAGWTGASSDVQSKTKDWTVKSGASITTGDLAKAGLDTMNPGEVKPILTADTTVKFNVATITGDKEINLSSRNASIVKVVTEYADFKYKLNYAHALTESGQYEDAMETIFRLSYESPADIRVTRLLAWAHLIQRHAKKAEPCYDKLLASAEANLADKLNAAYCYWFTGRMKQAVGLFREYVEKKDTPLDVAFVSDEELLGVYEVSEFDKQLLKELVERQPRDL